MTGAPRERGEAQESLKDEAAIEEGVGGWGARGGAGRVVAEPARPSEAVSVTNADDATHGLIYRKAACRLHAAMCYLVSFWEVQLADVIFPLQVLQSCMHALTQLTESKR